MIGDIWAALLGGTALGSVITFLLGFRRLFADSVISERQAWRENLRNLAVHLNDPKVPEDLWIELQTRLNPYDQKESELVDLVRSSAGKPLSEQDRISAVTHISELLKHDWERAKIEASIWSFCASRRATHKLDNLRHRSSS